MAPELTDDQAALLRTERFEIIRRWPEVVDREAAENATVNWLLGVLTATEAAQNLDEARAQVRWAMVVASQIARMEVLYGGRSEAETARTLHLDRMTVRKLLGK